MRRELLTVRPAAAYRDTFALSEAVPAEGGALPAGWEGLTFPFDTAFSDLRPDGSPARDGILPEFDLPRRMYAGEDTVFHRPLLFGTEIEQHVRVGTVLEKNGRSGRLVFADIVREYRADGELAVESTWHDVFLEAAVPGAPAPALEAAPATTPDWSEQLTLDSRQLFRFSALTFNTHRVHYDRAWATGEERLDDLLVHGPLTRILLLDAARRHRAGDVAEFRFRALAPVYVDRAFSIRGTDDGPTTDLLAVDAHGGVLARGTVVWRA